VWKNSNSLNEIFAATPTVLLSGALTPSLTNRAARFHIGSVLPLDVTTNQLCAAIIATVAGLAVTLHTLDEDQTTDWNAAGERFGEEPFSEHLTAREIDVLRLMALGLGNKEIATRLLISDHTAKFHVSSILAKLGATSRTEAVTVGIMRGLVAI
jgi:DNA-binding NarL/FixJ family response regulator